MQLAHAAAFLCALKRCSVPEVGTTRASRRMKNSGQNFASQRKKERGNDVRALSFLDVRDCALSKASLQNIELKARL
jgi:hypothetical protein